jgi:tetratricopeptide (TPR) repeat protein
VIEHIQAIHRDDPRAAVHSATTWVLENWQQQLPRDDTVKQQPRPEKSDSYTSVGGHLMRVIPITRRRGAALISHWGVPSPDTRWIGVSALEVTTDEFNKYRRDHESGEGQNPDGSLPVSNISADDAAGYCRWLTALAGIPDAEQCFVVQGNATTNDEEATPSTIAADYVLRRGFRVLDEEELDAIAHPEAEFAGSTDEDRHLLAFYARYAANSDGRFQRGGSSLPNQFGLFDTYGNAAEWIIAQPAAPFNRSLSHSQPEDTQTKCLGLLPAGGCVSSTTWQMGNRHAADQEVPSRFTGFRIARTLKAAPSDISAAASILAEQGEWEKALARFDQLSAIQPDNPFPLRLRSMLSAYLGDNAARRQLCREMLDRHENTDDAIVAHELACDLVLRGDTIDDWSRVQRLSRVAADSGQYPFGRSWAYLQVRIGQHEKARELLEELRQIDHGLMLVSTLLFQAMNYDQLNSETEARRCLHEAESLFEEIEAVREPGNYGQTWRGWLYTSLVLQEARSKLGR